MNESTALKDKNLLLEAATPLLALMVALKEANSPEDLDNFRMRVLDEINSFERRLKESTYSHRTVLAARYCLCTALDESIFKTSWGVKSTWLQQSLLATFNQESNGGEKFYVILEVLLEKAAENLDVLELIYFVLSLGFKGKFYQEEAKLENIREHLFRSLVGFKRGSGTWLQGKPKIAKHKVNHHFPLLVAIILIGSILLGMSLHLKNYSKRYANRVSAVMHNISLLVKTSRGQ